MFHLPSVPFWRNLGLTGIGLCLCACVLGTWVSGGEAFVIQFHSDGTPSTWASPWVLWGLLLMAVFSLLAASHPRRPSPGQKPLNPETACALFCGLSWLISLVALTLAIYALLPIPAVFYIGMVAAVLVIPLFLLVAALRPRRGSSPAG